MSFANNLTLTKIPGGSNSRLHRLTKPIQQQQLIGSASVTWEQSVFYREVAMFLGLTTFPYCSGFRLPTNRQGRNSRRQK
jgi:hypothetical protein